MSLSFTIGLPRSGKSSFAHNWRLEKPNRVIVRADDIRLALTGQRFNHKIEDYVSVIKHTMIKTLLLGTAEVLVDGTHTTWHSIKKLLAIDYNAQPIWIYRPNFDYMKVNENEWKKHAEVCKERAIITNQKDLLPVIDRMCEQVIELSKDFGIKLVTEREKAKCAHQ